MHIHASPIRLTRYTLWSKKSQQERLIEDSNRQHNLGSILQHSSEAIPLTKPYLLYLSIAAVAGLFLGYAASFLLPHCHITPIAKN